ncbi:MAG: polysaccharide deacetylase family protein [Myxococcota bacterium]
MLDVLARYDMRATFFVVGRAINRTTCKVLQRMVAEGHTLGVHSYNHDVGMAVRIEGKRAVAYVQHAVTQILIDLALIAEDPDHFDRLYHCVFGADLSVYLPSSALRTERAAYAARHRALLRSYGLDDGQYAYPVLYSRPPGGKPYLRQSPAWARRLQRMRSASWGS